MNEKGGESCSFFVAIVYVASMNEFGGVVIDVVIDVNTIKVVTEKGIK